MGAKPVVSTLTSGIINPSTLNSNFDILATAIADSLDRTGDSDTNNIMLGDLDMGGHKIKNVGDAVASSDIATKGYVDDLVTTLIGANVDAMERETFVATASQQVFTLASEPSNDLQVYINGVYQNLAAFAVAGTTLTLDDALPEGYVVEVIYPVELVGGASLVAASVSADDAEVSAATATTQAGIATTQAGIATAQAVIATAAAASATATTASGGSVTADPDAVAVRDSNGDLAGDILGSAAKVGVLNVKVIDIGTWNMNTTDTVSVAHGLTHSKIRSVFATISDFDSTYFYDLNYDHPNIETSGKGILWDSTNVILKRATGGYFDAPDYGTAPANRGWITIWYID